MRARLQDYLGKKTKTKQKTKNSFFSWVIANRYGDQLTATDRAITKRDWLALVGWLVGWLAKPSQAKPSHAKQRQDNPSHEAEYSLWCQGLLSHHDSELKAEQKLDIPVRAVNTE